MRATIEYLNHSNRLYAAKIEGYTDFVIIELLDNYPIDKGDVISHEKFTYLGKQTYCNLTKEIGMNVYVQDVCTINYVANRCMLEKI